MTRHPKLVALGGLVVLLILAAVAVIINRSSSAPAPAAAVVSSSTGSGPFLTASTMPQGLGGRAVPGFDQRSTPRSLTSAPRNAR